MAYFCLFYDYNHILACLKSIKKIVKKLIFVTYFITFTNLKIFNIMIQSCKGSLKRCRGSGKSNFPFPREAYLDPILYPELN
jgi:hypothetical protein